MKASQSIAVSFEAIHKKHQCVKAEEVSRAHTHTHIHTDVAKCNTLHQTCIWWENYGMDPDEDVANLKGDMIQVPVKTVT